MKPNELGRTAARWTLAGIGLGVASYAACVAVTWLRYRHVASPGPGDTLLDTFMPNYDVRERHHTRVAAPAAVTLAVATKSRAPRPARRACSGPGTLRADAIDGGDAIFSTDTRSSAPSGRSSRPASS